MALILEVLHKFDETFPLYSHVLPQTLVCNSKSDFCWNNICESCKDAQLFRVLYNLNGNDLDKHVEWYQWEKVPGPNRKEYLEKTLKKGSASVLYSAACAMLPSFLLHYFIKQQQVNAYEDHKMKVQNDSELAVLQIDFAENFSMLWQGEVQSAHWNKKQVTKFTSVTWQQDSCTSAVIISDDVTHSRDSVIIFIDKLLNSVIDESVKTLHIWSDVPSSQFKNIFTAASIPWLQQKHKLRICWNFFATSHGKGPVDGIGGVVKRMATQKVIQRKVNITNAA